MSLLTIASFLGALGAAGFLYCLAWCVHFFQAHWHPLLLLAPVLGFFLARLANRPSVQGWDQGHSPWHVPFLWLFSCASHFVGMSVGREGAAVQISSGISHAVQVRFHKWGVSSSLMAHAGAAAGFATTFLGPFSAFVFALEYKRTPSLPRALASLLGSLIGFWIGRHLHVPHWEPEFHIQSWTGMSVTPKFFISWWSVAILVGILAATYCRLETWALHLVHGKLSLYWRLTLAGLVTTLVTYYVGLPIYNNYSYPLLDASFHGHTSLWDSFGKLFFTMVASLGHWQGGVFVPLMVLGGMLGSQIAVAISWSASLGSAVGVLTFVAARFRIPLASLCLLGEILGAPIAVFGIPAIATICLLQWYWHKELPAFWPTHFRRDPVLAPPLSDPE